MPTPSRITLALILAVPLSMAAQTASPAATPPASDSAPQLSPKAAYEDAMHPLDATRNSVSNWSSIEIAVLKVTIAKAKASCLARDAHSFSGADLIDFAKLCGLGQEWASVVLATTLYIDAPTPEKPLLTEAHAARVDADLRLRPQINPLRDTRRMYAAVPYSPLVAEASDEAIAYLTFLMPADALTLATERQAFILSQIKQMATTADPSQTPKPQDQTAKAAATLPSNPQPNQPQATLHDLYAQGLKLATLQQLANQPGAADQTKAQLDQALPEKLTPDDLLRISTGRKQYALLGKPLGPLNIGRSLRMPNDKIPQIPATNTITSLLLFPDWCAQCVLTMGYVPDTLFHVEKYEFYSYGLLAETVPEQKPKTPINKDQLNASFDPAYTAAMLSEKPVVTVPPATLDQFAATDFPFLILTDANGIVRVAQAIESDDVLQGGKVDSAIALVGKRWPVTVQAARPTPAAKTPPLPTGHP